MAEAESGSIGIGDASQPPVQLADNAGFSLLRSGRFLRADLKSPHLCLCATFYQGGFYEELGHLVNHQSCEGAGHGGHMEGILHQGPVAYHANICGQMGLDPGRTALMGTAANMQYAALARESFDGLEVHALATAGVLGNGARVGDSASYVEHREGPQGAPSKPGTINIMAFVNRPMTQAAMVRAAMTITEAKTAALQELAVPSRNSQGLATGTGTDQLLLAAQRDDVLAPMTWSGHHTKLGELLGKAALRAVKESLLWQNGLEPSRTRNLFHILERFGLKPSVLDEQLRQWLEPGEFEFYGKNKLALFHDPQAAACAYALATTMDRVATGGFPPGAVSELLLNQCALLGAVVAVQPGQFNAIRNRLAQGQQEFVPLVSRALAEGWKIKWS